MSDTDSIVKCDGCGAPGRRRLGCVSPDHWFHIESTERKRGRDTGYVYIVWACSVACRDGMWKCGARPGFVEEERA